MHSAYMQAGGRTVAGKSVAHKSVGGKSINLLEQLHASGADIYYPTPEEIIAETPVPSIEYEGYDNPGSEVCPISLENEDVQIKIEEDYQPVEVFYAISGGVARVVHKPVAILAGSSLEYTVSDGVARKKPFTDFTVQNGVARKTTMTSASAAVSPTQDSVALADYRVRKGLWDVAGCHAPFNPRRNLSPPRYYPSACGKFLSSGLPPPRKNQPVIGNEHPSLVKKRSYEEYESEDEFIQDRSPSPSSHKKARIDNDDGFVLDHPSTASKQPLEKKPVKKRSYIKKADRPSKPGKQPISKPKSKVKKVTKPKKVKNIAEEEILNRPLLRELPRCPDLSEGTPQKKGSKWTAFEHEVLYLLLVEQRNGEISGDLNIKPLKDVPLFRKMSEQLGDFGINRTEYSARNYWNRHGRPLAGWDERTDSYPGRSLVTSAQESKAKESKMYD
ncbi:hypothetical protein IFR05_008667 [Cadophora sp. M221]|nr:hypothetical protein IFR05_008667 [Cadophora sp. M221]